MIAAGTYRAQAVDAVLGRTGTGKEQIAVRFEIPAFDERPAQHITWYGYFTDATFERTVQSLRYLGWRGNDLGNFAGGLPPECGNEVEIVVEHDEDQDGDKRARVRWINSGMGIAVKERLEESEARAFGARMKARIAAVGMGSKPSNGTAPATPATHNKPAPAPPARSRRTGRQAVAERARPANFDPPPAPPDITDDDIPF